MIKAILANDMYNCRTQEKYGEMLDRSVKRVMNTGDYNSIINLCNVNELYHKLQFLTLFNRNLLCGKFFERFNVILDVGTSTNNSPPSPSSSTSSSHSQSSHSSSSNKQNCCNLMN